MSKKVFVKEKIYLIFYLKIEDLIKKEFKPDMAFLLLPFLRRKRKGMKFECIYFKSFLWFESYLIFGKMSKGCFATDIKFLFFR